MTHESFKQHGVTIGGRKYITDEHGRFHLEDEQEDDK